MNASAANLLTRSNAQLDPFAGLDPKLVKQTQKWVGQTFFGTILKQMRESPFKDQIFSGGRGGEAFGAMFDQRLADQMSRGAGSKLVRAIARKLEGRRAYQKAHAQTASSPQKLEDNVPRASENLNSEALTPIPGTRNPRR